MQATQRYLTEGEQSRLLALVKSHAGVQAARDRAWISLLRNTGLRVGEFSVMTVRQARLALEAGWLFIPKAHRKGGQRDHSVMVTEPVRADLRALLTIQRDMGRLYGKCGADDEPLVLSQKGNAMSIRSYQDRMRYWCRQIGITASVHWLRHTRAMNIMRRSTSSDPRGIAQAALGHATIASTGIYTGVTREELEAQLRQVDGGPRVPRRKMRAAFEGRAS